MASPTKGLKRVVIIDPVPIIEIEPAAAINSRDNANFEGPPRSALKSSRRHSMLTTTAPAQQIKHVTLQRLSEPVEPDVFSPRSTHTLEDVSMNEDEELVPEHHQVLYELLGADKAESILNPKMEEPSKKEEISEAKQRRKLPAVDTGMGAESLWKLLKKESDRKLEKMDNKIPVDWKVSYGAFLRESINQNRLIVHRSFTGHTDVPELDKLLDKKYKGRVKRARHHMNVMYRSSENNKNKTTVLLNNNPVPDYVDREGSLPITRYFGADLDLTTPREVLPKIESPRAIRSAADFDAETSKLRDRFSNLHFLTEDRATTKGKFYGKYADSDIVKMVTDFPGYKSKLPPSMTQRVTVSAPVHSRMGPRGLLHRRGPLDPHSQKREPTWQPLTAGALMEYAPTKSALGWGEFRFGQSARWQMPAPSTA